MARAAAQKKESETKYANVNEAMVALAMKLRRALAEFQTEVKMANIEKAGPMNVEARRTANKEFLKQYRDKVADAFETILDAI